MLYGPFDWIGGSHFQPMRIRQAEHGEAFRDIAFEPSAEVWSGFGVSLHQEAEFLIGGGDIPGIPYRA